MEGEVEVGRKVKCEMEGSIATCLSQYPSLCLLQKFISKCGFILLFSFSHQFSERVGTMGLKLRIKRPSLFSLKFNPVCHWWFYSFL